MSSVRHRLGPMAVVRRSTGTGLEWRFANAPRRASAAADLPQGTTMPLPRPPVPARAWVVTFAGTAVNLCLGILYAWSVWKAHLIATPEHPPGTPMTGLDAGWVYLRDAEATWAYALCGFTFALFMIPGGLLQDRLGP